MYKTYNNGIHTDIDGSYVIYGGMVKLILIVIVIMVYTFGFFRFVPKSKLTAV